MNKISDNFFISSWDDGFVEDIYLANLLLENNIPAIFFIPTHYGKRTLNEENILRLSQMGFEIGGHTTNHPSDMKTLSYEKQLKEIVDNKKYLEDIIHKKIEWFAYPRGRYNEETIQALKEAGYKYARTTLVLNIEKPIDQYRIHSSAHVYPGRKEYNGRSWLEVAIELWEKAIKKENGYFHLFGHSCEIEEYNIWEQLEEFFKYVTK